jgi:3-hydroxyacyl-CoA dehydrogenase/enoyl-CoA hydratase/3-hydroxybutyryl-CoA epimerase
MESGTLRWRRDPDGIVVLTLNDPDRPVNLINAEFTRAMATAIEEWEHLAEPVTGVVITSAKPTFCAGSDLTELVAARPANGARIAADVIELKALFRRLEALAWPVVAAINGSALGSGFELALACHHRIAADVPGSAIGLPEATLGLLPGHGGTVRAVRLLGLRTALVEVLLSGQRRGPADALALGLIDRVVGSVDELVPAAKAWISAHPDACVQPWHRPGFEIPGGTSLPGTLLPKQAAPRGRQLDGAPTRTSEAILTAATEGALLDIDAAELVETQTFVELVTGKVAKNMIGAFFFDLKHIRAAQSRPAGQERFTARKVGIVGPGTMGSGIAYACARSGIDVVLKGVSGARAERGRERAGRLAVRAVANGLIAPEDSTEYLSRIRPTADPGELRDVDMVIETVVEDPAVKHAVFAEIEPVVRPDVVLATNTSTLPITGLAGHVRHRENVVGLHFFSPADRMPLVEIVRGERTSDAAVAAAFDLARSLGKTPIVVGDGPGFFTTRVITAYLDEVLTALGEGVEPAIIEQAAARAGYPTTPLALMDELTLTLTRTLRQQTVASGRAGDDLPAAMVLGQMIDEFGRTGRPARAGFYEYGENGGRTRIWPGVRSAFTPGSTLIPFPDLQERLLFTEALEAARCFDAGVLHSVPDANIGSLLGIGFPAWTGGVVRYIEQYADGVPGFVSRARELAASYGARFAPPASLVEAAESGIDLARFWALARDARRAACSWGSGTGTAASNSFV